MAPCSLRALAVLLVARAAAVAAAEDGADVLAADDECAVGSPGDSPGCALSAVQLRSGRVDSPSAEAAHRANRSEADGSQSWNPFSSSSSSSNYDASCYGSVGSESCLSSKSGGKCVCENGCMGADGNCYGQSNRVVAKDFTLKNYKWSDHVMYVQRVAVFNQIKTTGFSSAFNFGQDKFTLYELPGQSDGQKEYFLASSKWPDWVLAFDATGGTAVSLWGLYAVGLNSRHQPWDLRDIMLRVCDASSKGHPGAIMIGSSMPSGGSTIWAYIHSTSYFVYGYWFPESLLESKLVPSSQPKETPGQLPGDGGFWIPDPPLPMGILPPC